jgi:hypothetical protein
MIFQLLTSLNALPLGLPLILDRKSEDERSAVFTTALA